MNGTTGWPCKWVAASATCVLAWSSFPCSMHRCASSRGIDVCSGEVDNGVNGDGDGDAPAGGDHNPAGIVAGGFLQGHIGIHAAPKQDKQEGPDQFCGEVTHAPECTELAGNEKESLVTVRLRTVRA